MEFTVLKKSDKYQGYLDKYLITISSTGVTKEIKKVGTIESKRNKAKRISFAEKEKIKQQSLELKLPELIGSLKQKEWANGIRYRYLKKNPDQFETAKKEIESKFWIEMHLNNKQKE